MFVILNIEAMFNTNVCEQSQYLIEYVLTPMAPRSPPPPLEGEMMPNFAGRPFKFYQNFTLTETEYISLVNYN